MVIPVNIRELGKIWCRLVDDKSLKTNCPSPFSSKSGKHNFHPGHGGALDDILYQAAVHLQSMCDEQYKGKFFPACAAD